jgi:adenosine deaminase
MRDFVQALPKTETHLHIEGGLPYQLLRAWQPERQCGLMRRLHELMFSSKQALHTCLCT